MTGWILCRYGVHRWKPVHRLLAKPRQEQFMQLVIPSLFAGPPYLAPTGIFYTVNTEVVGRKCARCGERRSA